MSTVNHLAREVAAKIVFYGPGLSGKTTTLKKIYESVKPAHRGELMSLPTEADRTLFFDFLPVRVERVGDCAVRLALYTVPGQVFYNATRKLVLQGADGVVFVADSQAAAFESNMESLRNLEENLAEQGIQLEKFPLVVQYNKRDLPTAMSLEDLRASLNPRQCPDYESCATSGRGVLDVLKAITRQVIRDLRVKRVVLPPRPAAPIASLSEGQHTLEDQIRDQLSRSEESEAQWSGPAPSEPSSSEADGGVEPMVAPPIEPSPSTDPEAPIIALGPAAALAPSALLDYARAADHAFAEGDHEGCIRACIEAVRRALAFAGSSEPFIQAYLLGVDGTDLLKLEQLPTRPLLRLDDSAFALYVLMQVLVRMSAAGLPLTE